MHSPHYVINFPFLNVAVRQAPRSCLCDLRITTFGTIFLSFSGCYKRSKDIDFVFGKVEAKQEDRPSTFYFGQKGDDIDSCEAACKNERDCSAYTLYKVYNWLPSGMGKLRAF